MLGTDSSDGAFLPARITQWVNDSYNTLVSDLPGAFLVKSATLVADGGAGNVYTLSTQAVPIADWRQFRDVRLINSVGAQLDEVGYDDLSTWQGPCYAVTGVDASVMVITSPAVTPASAVWCLYAYWPTELVADGDMPSSIPARFHDLLSLMTVRLAFGSGGEQRFPDVYQERLEDRHAQFRMHVGQRSGTPQRLRIRDDTWVTF